MGIQDRDWYWAERERKEKLHYQPKLLRGSRSAAGEGPRWRPGFGTGVAVVLVVALAFAPSIGRWLSAN